MDKWAKEVEKDSGKIISKPEEFGEGYYVLIIADPDGYTFNVFYSHVNKFVLQHIEIKLLLRYERCPKVPFQQSN